MLFQFQIDTIESLALLCRQIVLNFFELRMIAQKYMKLVLDLLRVFLQLPNSPAVHIPAQMNHTILFQQVIIELSGCYKLLIMGTLIINLPGSPKAAKENLEAVLPAIGHGLEMLSGRPADCAKLTD